LGSESVSSSYPKSLLTSIQLLQSGLTEKHAHTKRPFYCSTRAAKKGHHSVLKADLKLPQEEHSLTESQDFFTVKFVCVGLHGVAFKPMHVLIQANVKNGTKTLQSAPFILRGSRTPTRPQLLRYYEEHADKNFPRTFPTLVPAPAPTPPTTTTTTTTTLIPAQPQVAQPIIQENQDHRANPPETTLIPELSALETQGVPNPTESFFFLGRIFRGIFLHE